MSLDFERIQTRPPQSRFAWALVHLLAIPLVIPIAGCGPSEPKEISAATSGYMPAEKTAAKSTSVDSRSAALNSDRTRPSPVPVASRSAPP